MKLCFGNVCYPYKQKFIFWELIVILKHIFLKIILVNFMNDIKFGDCIYPYTLMMSIVFISMLL